MGSNSKYNQGRAVMVYLSGPEERSSWHARAGEKGMKLSEWIKWIVDEQEIGDIEEEDSSRIKELLEQNDELMRQIDQLDQATREKDSHISVVEKKLAVLREDQWRHEAQAGGEFREFRLEWNLDLLRLLIQSKMQGSKSLTSRQIKRNLPQSDFSGIRKQLDLMIKLGDVVETDNGWRLLK